MENSAASATSSGGGTSTTNSPTGSSSENATARERPETETNRRSSISSSSLTASPTTPTHSKNPFAAWNGSTGGGNNPVDLSVPSSGPSLAASHITATLANSLPMFGSVGLTTGLISTFGNHFKCTTLYTGAFLTSIPFNHTISLFLFCFKPQKALAIP